MSKAPVDYSRLSNRQLTRAFKKANLRFFTAMNRASPQAHRLAEQLALIGSELEARNLSNTISASLQHDAHYRGKLAKQVNLFAERSAAMRPNL